MTVEPAESAQHKRVATPAQRASLAKARAARGRPSDDAASRSRQRKPRPTTAPTAAAETGELIRLGQPPKMLDPTIQGRILGALQIGCTYDAACGVGGISTRAFEKCRARAAEFDDDELEDIPPLEVGYVEFARKARLARSEAQVRYLSQIRVALMGRPGKVTTGEDGSAIVEPPILPDWRAAAWMMEHLYPEQYGRNYRINPEQREQITRELLQTLDQAFTLVGIDEEQRKALGKAILGLASPA